MKIAIIGASGYVGSALTQEALSRGHEVTALVSNPAKIAAAPGLQALAANVQDAASLPAALAGYDVVISAFSGHAQADTETYFVTGFKNLLAAAKTVDVKRLAVVGGAGSLEVAPGLQLLDTPQFPAEYKATAEGARTALNLLRQQNELNWVMLSPAAMLEPGQRTTQYRLGGDQLLVDAAGNSKISVQDFAHAMINEVEQPQHHNQRFTLAY